MENEILDIKRGVAEKSRQESSTSRLSSLSKTLRPSFFSSRNSVNKFVLGRFDILSDLKTLVCLGVLTTSFLFCNNLFASSGTASWYSVEACKYNPSKSCPTASGHSLYELEKNKVDFLASWDYPLRTKLKVCNKENGKCVTASVLDRGANKRLKRIVDLSKNTFSKIADTKKGLINVTVEKI